MERVSTGARCMYFRRNSSWELLRLRRTSGQNASAFLFGYHPTKMIYIYIIYSKPHHQTYDYYGFPMWKYMKCGTNIHDQIVRWSGGYRALFHRWWCPFGDESCLNTSMGQRPQTWTFGCDWFFWTNLENLREDKNPQLGIVVSGRIDNLLKLMISHDFKWFHSSSIKADLTNLNSTVLLNHLTTWFSKWIEKWLTMINHD